MQIFIQLNLTFQMTDTCYQTMTQQPFSTDPMLTNTIENRQLPSATTGKIYVILIKTELLLLTIVDKCIFESTENYITES